MRVPLPVMGGSALFLVTQTYLQDLLKPLGTLSDRWLLWMGVLFILSVYYFPTGIVGRLRGKT